MKHKIKNNWEHDNPVVGKITIVDRVPVQKYREEKAKTDAERQSKLQRPLAPNEANKGKKIGKSMLEYK